MAEEIIENRLKDSFIDVNCIENMWGREITTLSRRYDDYLVPYSTF